MRLEVSAPFDLQATVRLLQRLPSNRIDAWRNDRYWRALLVDGRPVLCVVENRGTADAPELRLTVTPRPAAPALLDVQRALRTILGLDLAPGFELPGIRNRKLVAVARALRGARPPRFPTLFEALGRIVPYQQVSLEAGAVLVSRFVERFGLRVDAPDGPVWAFPDAANVASASPTAFKGLGLSRTKSESLQRLARIVASGEVTEQALAALPTEAALQRLDALPGVGPWTAGLVLLRGLGRMEVFPSSDVGAQKGLRSIVGSAVDLDALIERAGDRRGYLYFYALASKLSAKGLISRVRARTQGS